MENRYTKKKRIIFPCLTFCPFKEPLMPLSDEEDPLLVKLGAGLAGQHSELRFVELHAGAAMWDSCVICSVLLHTPTNNVTESFTEIALALSYL